MLFSNAVILRRDMSKLKPLALVFYFKYLFRVRILKNIFWNNNLISNNIYLKIIKYIIQKLDASIYKLIEDKLAVLFYVLYYMYLQDYKLYGRKAANARFFAYLEIGIQLITGWNTIYFGLYNFVLSLLIYSLNIEPFIYLSFCFLAIFCVSILIIIANFFFNSETFNSNSSKVYNLIGDLFIILFLLNVIIILFFFLLFIASSINNLYEFLLKMVGGNSSKGNTSNHPSGGKGSPGGGGPYDNTFTSKEPENKKKSNVKWTGGSKPTDPLEPWEIEEELKRKKTQEYNHNYYVENKEKIQQRDKKRYVEHKEEICERSRKRHIENREEILKRHKIYSEQHKKEKREYMVGYSKENKQNIQAYRKKRAEEEKALLSLLPKQKRTAIQTKLAQEEFAKNNPIRVNENNEDYKKRVINGEAKILRKEKLEIAKGIAASKKGDGSNK